MDSDLVYYNSESGQYYVISDLPGTAALTNDVNNDDPPPQEEECTQLASPVIEKSWTRNSTLALINLYKLHIDDFKSTTLKREKVWKIIEKEICEQGFLKTHKQCEDRWKNLRKKYIQKKDSKKRSGAPALHFDYEDELDEIYGQKPNITPIAVASSLSGSVCAATPEIAAETQPKKRKNELEKLRDEMNEREENRQKRHKENLEMQQKSLETFKLIMDKFLEKF